jgi:hypothetical protein
MMKKGAAVMDKKKGVCQRLVIGILFLIVFMVGLFYCNLKDGMNEDEVVTFGLANSHYATWLCDIKEDFANGEAENVLTQKEILSYLTVDKGEEFDFGSVYANQKNDVHPPMYYWLLNISSSFFPSTFSKWIGLVPNLILYLMILVLLYFTSKKLFQDEIIAVIVMLSYGLSLIGLSTMLFIRMYILLTFFTVLLVFEIVCLMKNERKYLYPCIALTILGGLLTQYNYVFYAFFVCAAFLLYLISKKNFRSAWKFCVSSIIGAGSLPLVYPYIFYQIRHGANSGSVSGENSLHNLLDISGWLGKLKQNISVCIPETKTIWRIAIIVFLVILLSASISTIIDTIKKTNQVFLQLLVFLIPAGLSFFSITITAPAITERYFYHLMPVLLLIIGYELYLVKELGSTSFEKERFYYLIILILVVNIRQYKTMDPSFLYNNFDEYGNQVAQYSTAPCLFIDAGVWSSINEEPLQFLIESNDVFIAKEIGSAKMKNYISSHDDNTNLIVYIDTGIADSDAVLNQIADDLHYTEPQMLFVTLRAKVYLLKELT